MKYEEIKIRKIDEQFDYSLHLWILCRTYNMASFCYRYANYLHQNQSEVKNIIKKKEKKIMIVAEFSVPLNFVLET